MYQSVALCGRRACSPMSVRRPAALICSDSMRTQRHGKGWKGKSTPGGWCRPHRASPQRAPGPGDPENTGHPKGLISVSSENNCFCTENCRYVESSSPMKHQPVSFVSTDSVCSPPWNSSSVCSRRGSYRRLCLQKHLMSPLQGRLCTNSLGMCLKLTQLFSSSGRQLGFSSWCLFRSHTVWDCSARYLFM